MDTRMPFKRYHTLRRLINWGLIKLQLAMRSSFILGYPYSLVIESTNICNLKCPLCPTGMGIPGREKGKMRLVNFKKIIDEIGGYVYSLRLENWGEPLLNEDIYDAISYAKLKKICVSFNTNLTFLTEENAERLILSGLDHIKISLDGATPETYTQYRIGGDFKRVVENIKALISRRRLLNKNNPFIEIQFIIMKHNEHELKDIKRLCADLKVDALLLEKARPDMREELFNSDARSIEKFREWLPTNSKYSVFDYNTKDRKARPQNCSYLWTTAVINWDGSVVPCCSIYDEQYDFGNILEQGLRGIWNGDKYRAARMLMGRGKNNGIETACLNCFRRGIIT
jgi:radical SAM protein with 4Fe4S-binding SPASM domain